MSEDTDTIYIVEYWHTERKSWVEDYRTIWEDAARGVYAKTLDWHYAKTVRLRKAVYSTVLQSKEPG